MIAVEFVSYVGSFPVSGSDQPTRADNVRTQLEQENKKRKPVLLVISLAGIKVCSPDGKNVFMAHALRRISYATCDSENCQFSFLAREPKGHFNLQYCHSFITESPDQAEELNTIVGNAFRMAYVAQLHKQQHKHQQTSFSNANNPSDVQPYAVTYSPVHNHRLQSNFDNNQFVPLSNHSSPSSEKRRLLSSPARNLNNLRSDWVKQGGKVEDFKGGSLKGDHHRHSAEMNMLSGVGTSPFRLQMDEANGNLLAAINKTMGLPEKPNSLPGLQSQALRTSHSSDELLTPSSLSSDDANSPTEMNSYKRLVDKPPLIKRLTMTIEKSPEDELRPLVKDPAGDNRTPSSSSGYANDGLASQSSDSIATDSQNDEPQSKLFVRINSNSSSPVHNVSKMNGLKSVSNAIPSPPPSEGYADHSSDGSKRSSRSSEGQCPPMHDSLFIQDPKESPGLLKGDPKVKRISQTSVSSTCSSSTPPPLPESRYDSLQTNYLEEKELRKAPWFQAGIPREIALEILGQEPVGAFMVRESTSKPGCYALSLRVPKEFQVSGIAHYLIMRTNKGYKIKGFTKEFITLTALITHHSVMPELLPCPLCLSRYNPNFAKHDSNQDFADLDDDPDYNTLADFRKMMADLNV